MSIILRVGGPAAALRADLAAMGVPVIYILAHLLLAVVAHVLRHCSEAAREWAAGGPTGNGGMRACAPARCTLFFSFWPYPQMARRASRRPPAAKMRVDDAATPRRARTRLPRQAARTVCAPPSSMRRSEEAPRIRVKNMWKEIFIYPHSIGHGPRHKRRA